MMNRFVYVPQDPRSTNLMKFANRNGISDRDELYNRADSDPGWFWPAVIRDTGIEFFKDYETLFDSSQGIPWTRWFVGGQINITFNCVEKRKTVKRVALRYSSEDGEISSMTYAELDNMTGKLAGSLVKLGIMKGERVGIYLPPTIEAVVAFYSILRMGAIAVPLFSGYGREALRTRINDAGIRYLFTTPSFKRRGKVVNMVSNLSGIDGIHLILCGKDIDSSLLKMSDLIEMGRYMESARTESEDPAIMLYTSGTTGVPKGTIHTHAGTLINIAKEVKYYMDCREDDTIHWISDLGWMMGPWYIIGGNCLGATVFLYNGSLDYPDRERLWKEMEENHVSLLGLSPTFVRSLKAGGEGRPIKTVRVFGSTGEAWDEESWMWLFNEIGGSRIPISNISGGTDIIGCFLASTPAHPLMPRCLYRGLGMKASVFDDSGNEIFDEVGHLVSKGHLPSMTRGVWKKPELYISNYWMKFPGTWVQGDWAVMDREGYFFINGRSDDVMKIAGKRLGPGEVENQVMAVKGVNEAAAVGVEDQIKGESLAIFYSGENTQSTVDEIMRAVENGVGKSFLPKYVIWVPSLPKTRNGKIVRRAVRSAFLNIDIGDTSNIELPEAIDYIREVGRAYGQ